MKTISVLIPDGEHPLALRVIRSLGLTRRVSVDLITSDRWGPSRLSRFCRHHHVTRSTISSSERCDAILTAITAANIDVLLPVSVAGIRLLAAERQTFAQRVALPPLPDTATLDLANDKAALCHFAQLHDVPTPPFLVFPDEVPDQAALEQLPFPVLLKPPSLEGGRGIRLFDDPQSLADYLRTNRARCILQSYLTGLDYGFNALCRDGEILAHTAQRNSLSASPPFGPAAGIHVLQDAEVLETGRRLLSALRWNGVANLDVLRCAATGTTMVLEMNPRYWATLMGSVRAGVNFPYLACLAGLNLPIPQTDYQPVTYAERSVALRQTLRMVTGRSHLPQFSLKNSALWTSFVDPLPTLAHCCNGALSITGKHAATVYRRARKGFGSP